MKAYTASSEYKARCGQLEAFRLARNTFLQLERLHRAGETWQCPDCGHRQLGKRFVCGICGTDFGTVLP
jgi:DNA-directed RNA polymerase subunit RPC12/RpoP